MIKISGSDERDGAGMVAAICIGMNPLVQLRRNAEDERPEKGSQSGTRDRSTPARAAFHWQRLSPDLTKYAMIFCGRRQEIKNEMKIRPAIGNRAPLVEPYC